MRVGSRLKFRERCKIVVSACKLSIMFHFKSTILKYIRNFENLLLSTRFSNDFMANYFRMTSHQNLHKPLVVFLLFLLLLLMLSSSPLLKPIPVNIKYKQNSLKR